MRKVFLLLAVFLLGSALAQTTLETVRARGTLICGVHNTGLVGFTNINTDGTYSGFDVDFCRAVAAAVLGDANAVEFRGLSAQERFTGLQTGVVDVLIRNTTWTSNRDTALGLNFAPTTFYDGQGFMARKNANITELDDLDGTTVCVQSGTTTESNLADVMAANDIEYTPLVFNEQPQLLAAYEEGACDAWTTDKSGLVAELTKLSNPADHVILEATISKEPLGPAVRHGDDQWFDIVKWVVYTTFLAEEYGITSANVDQELAESEDANVQRLLGATPEQVVEFGLEGSAFYNVIKQVGNYAEIYERNLGEGTPTYVPRGLNESYINGGLHYAPPIK
ncbi:MAG: amino acid ABC transporter substrate-binding protein [Trueperaceae bacterium]